MATESNGNAEAAEAERLVDYVDTVAGLDALRHVGNQLAGELFARQQTNTDPAAADALRDERRGVLARLSTVEPGSDEVTATLEAWGARLRALRDQ